ncbi:hypothetical protein KC19_7G092400 [Ceratodon purpureus]|uniref:Heterokaryon incompatibility domain-containing protein n=1 Tax=Ceratodon purpureus TaxID=3225 RepID=A0A8T0H856_CERPU|nr:hypothetical protein KC19_7G092400 [Ceratodon purpureus]
MDHYPLPWSASGHLKIPCISTGNYDKGPFSSFPARQKWEVKLYEDSIDDALSHGGVTPSVEETEGFLQTWLYFGTLCEVFGEHVNLLDFIDKDEGGNRFLYSGKFLEVAVKVWFVQSQGVLESVQSLCDRAHSHLLSLFAKLAGLSTVSEIADSTTLLAAAVLGESLDIFMKVLIYCSKPFMDKMKKEASFLRWGNVFPGWITKRFKSSGWCPSSIARLYESAPPLCQLYYCCQLPAPMKDKDHSSCTVDSCLALKIEPSTYHVVHRTDSCECPELTLDVERIGETLRKGRVPLIQIASDGDPAHPNIFLIEDDGNVDFVAISHVWADGLGNVRTNALPACRLHEISRLVSELPKGSQQSELVPFWIDTVCVPVEPSDLQELALNYLRYPYTNAKHVLVLDEYLRTVDSKDCDVLDIFARLTCGNWNGRMWTLQEGQLAKRVWFQFRDKAIELKALVEGYEILGLLKGIFYLELLIRFRVRWSATRLSDQGSFDNIKEQCLIWFLRDALQFRSVSVPADEALCLFCLADLDMATITSVKASTDLRMRTFWSQMQIVPAGLIFSQSQHKLEERGYRWAPSTFLGSVPGNHWMRSLMQSADGRLMVGLTTPSILLLLAGRIGIKLATRTEHGLRAQFPAYICNVTWDGTCEVFYFCCAGNWFKLYSQKPWHAKSAYVPPNGPQNMAIFLVYPLHDRAVQQSQISSQYCIGDVNLDVAKEEPRLGDGSHGMIGCITHEEAGTKYVKCLSNVAVVVLRPIQHFIFSVALKSIAEFQDEHRTQSQDRDPSALKRTTTTYFEKYPKLSSACELWRPDLSPDDCFLHVMELMMGTADRSILVDVDVGEEPEEQYWCFD